ncbi:endolytic transglycosylase MltG [Weissella kandleri]|uniref:endolytic transglycosylase MltG n=1 Tax=Weissella kandleri TaxID=1616 RepID=UPI00387EB89F
MPFEPRNKRYEKEKPRLFGRKKKKSRQPQPNREAQQAAKAVETENAKVQRATSVRNIVTESNAAPKPGKQRKDADTQNAPVQKSQQYESESANETQQSQSKRLVAEDKTQPKISQDHKAGRLSRSNRKMATNGKNVKASRRHENPKGNIPRKAPQQARGKGKKRTRFTLPKNWLLILIGILLIGGISYGVYSYQRNNNYTAVEPKNKKNVEIYVPQGTSLQQIGDNLANKKLVHSSQAFTHYVRAHNATNILAGYYELNSSMDMSTLVENLLAGGSDTPLYPTTVLTMTEGETIDSFANKVGKVKQFSKKEFLAKVNDSKFVDQLAQQYPQLLKSDQDAKDMRYRLEGYLYPATYNYENYKSVDELITAMVAKTNAEMLPYYQTIKDSNMSVHQILTVASLVQAEGVGDTDMRKIAGVFLNRLDIEMPIQSDVAVKYALHTNKVNLTVDDTMVDSPYNLYRNAGYGPGPFNNPSIQAIKAVLNPLDRDQKYLYFVANLKTGAITYTTNQNDHDAAVAKVDATNQSMQNKK